MKVIFFWVEKERVTEMGKEQGANENREEKKHKNWGICTGFVMDLRPNSKSKNTGFSVHFSGSTAF